MACPHRRPLPKPPYPYRYVLGLRLGLMLLTRQTGYRLLDFERDYFSMTFCYSSA